MAFRELERGEHRPTYLDVWPGTTCGLAWLVACFNTLGVAEKSVFELNTNCGPAWQIVIY
jgi:hypothetical protein